MTEGDLRNIVLTAFSLLRQAGFSLAVRELLVGLRALDAQQSIGDERSVRDRLRLLWCNSRQEARHFDAVWHSVILGSLVSTAEEHQTGTPGGEVPVPIDVPTKVDHVPEQPGPELSEWAALPIQVPGGLPFAPRIAGTGVESYHPLSRESMIYAWRRLRRPARDGPPDVLDLEETVEQVARQGFFLAPVYRRRDRNYAHLFLFADQGGSMVPFHRFTRDLIDTAANNSTIRHVEAVYFHNVPDSGIYADRHLTSHLDSSEAINRLGSEVSLLIISDAGAARGFRDMERIRATAKFLSEAREQTHLIAWLNPLPEERWTNTSADVIRYLVPMFQMDDDGLSSAVDIIGGQVSGHDR